MSHLWKYFGIVHIKLVKRKESVILVKEDKMRVEVVKYEISEK